MASNSWLRGHRKTDLAELAEKVGLPKYEGLKKSELELALDEHISENSSRFALNPELNGYFNSRSKALGSPIKREIKEEPEKVVKTVRRRATKLAEEITPESDPEPVSLTTTVTQTPARGFQQVAARISLPATPADVAMAVDRSTVAVRHHVHSLYQESGIAEYSQATRETLSTVTSVLFLVSAFELWYVRPEVLANRYAFTVPAIPALKTSDYPVYLPDMFLLLTASFWSPALTWAFTSGIVPCIFGYFFNLSAKSTPAYTPPRGRRAPPNEYVVDPLTFSIAKALASYVVYAQGVTFNGLLSETSIERLNGAVYGGYKGMLVGTAITGLVSIYDAVLKK